MIDPVTLFLANAIALTVMAVVMATIRLRQPDAPYLTSWIADKVLLVASMVFFVLDPPGADPLLAGCSNLLMVAGFGFRWRAARQFNGRSAPWLWSAIIPVSAASLRFASPATVPFAFVFCLTNLILVAQSLATLWEFWRDRGDGLTSRYGLVLSYGLIGACSCCGRCRGSFRASTSTACSSPTRS